MKNCKWWKFIRNLVWRLCIGSRINVHVLDSNINNFLWFSGRIHSKIKLTLNDLLSSWSVLWGTFDNCFFRKKNIMYTSLVYGVYVIKNISPFKDNFFFFRSTSPSQSTDVVTLDYIVDGQLVTELDEGETVSLNFLKKVKAKENKVSGSNCIFLFYISCCYVLRCKWCLWC